MASNTDQLANELGQMLLQGLAQVVDQASHAPDRFADIIQKAIDTAGDLAEKPKAILEVLNQAAKHPDWLSLMILAAVELQKVVGENLKVRAWDSESGWSRALTLIYTQPLSEDGKAELQLSIALGDDIDGFIIKTIGEPAFDRTAGPLRVLASGTEEVDFRIPIGGSVERRGGAGRLYFSAISIGRSGAHSRPVWLKHTSATTRQEPIACKA